LRKPERKITRTKNKTKNKRRRRKPHRYIQEEEEMGKRDRQSFKVSSL